MTPGQEFWFRLKSCNKINCSPNSLEYKLIVEGIFFIIICVYTHCNDIDKTS